LRQVLDWDIDLFVKHRLPLAIGDLTSGQEHMVCVGAVHKLLGGQIVSDREYRSRDRTRQAGQSARDTIWWDREYRTLLGKEKDDLFMRMRAEARPRYIPAR